MMTPLYKLHVHHQPPRSGSFTSYASASEQQLFRSAASSVVSAATTPRTRAAEGDAKPDTVGGADWATAAAAALRTAEATSASPKANKQQHPTSPSGSPGAPPKPASPPPAQPPIAYPAVLPAQHTTEVPAHAKSTEAVQTAVQTDAIPGEKSTAREPSLPPPTKQLPPTSPAAGIKMRTSWAGAPTAPPALESEASTPRIGAHMPSWVVIPPVPAAEPSAFSPLANGAPTVHQRLASRPPVSPEQLVHWEVAEQQQLAAVLLEEEAALQELGLSPVARSPAAGEDGMRASWHHFGSGPGSGGGGVLGLSMDGGWDRKIRGTPVALMPPVKNMWGLR